MTREPMDVDIKGIADRAGNPDIFGYGGFLRFRAASVTGPRDVCNRRVYVNLSMRDVADLLAALPAVSFEQDWTAFLKVQNALRP